LATENNHLETLQTLCVWLKVATEHKEV